MGVIRAVVTQNIDGLHQKAGCRRVLEVHGNLTNCRCTGCGKEYSYDVLDEQLKRKSFLPVSLCCAKLLRPAVVLFGDRMAPDFWAAKEEASGADFALVIGTSLTVYPAAEIPREAGRFAIINREGTPLDRQAVLKIKGSAGEILASLVKYMKTSN